MSELSPLSGVKRKLEFGAVRSVDDLICMVAFFWVGSFFPEAVIGAATWLIVADILGYCILN